MKRLFLTLLTVALLASPAAAQFASKISWGLTMPMIKVALDSANSGDTSFLEAGAGVVPMFNLAPSSDGRWRMVTFGLPQFINYEKGFGWDAGITIGTLNNLLSFGVATVLVKTSDDGSPAVGLFAGDGFSRENTYLVFSASLNFGGGSAGTPEMAAKIAAAREPVHSRPPGYVGW